MISRGASRDANSRVDQGPRLNDTGKISSRQIPHPLPEQVARGRKAFLDRGASPDRGRDLSDSIDYLEENCPK